MRQTAPLELKQSISYRPNPSAIPFHDSPAQVKALMGPVGSGKSLAWMFELIMLAIEANRPVRAVVIRQSWPELRDSTKVTWNEKLEALSDWRERDHQMLFTLPGRDGRVRTHTLDFRHARTSADATRFLSTEYAMIILEECVPAFDVGRNVIGGGIAKEIFEVALSRQRQSGMHRIHLICVFNPPSKRHWTYELLVGPAKTEAGRELLRRKDFAFFEQPPFENQQHLPSGYYDRLLEQLSPDLAQRFVYGKPMTVYPGMPVYPDIIEDYHIVAHVPLVRDLGVVSMHDFGRTPAAVIAQVTKEGQMRVVGELQLWGASSEKMAETLDYTLLSKRFKPHPWLRGWGDPAGQNPTETDDRTSFTIMAAKGYPLAAGAETVAARLEAVKQRASRAVGREPALLIDGTECPMLADAILGGYRYPKSGDGQIGFHPLKNDYSHIANALEYGVSGEFSYLTGQRLREDPKRAPAGRNIPQNHPLSTPRRGGRGSWMSN